MQHMMPTATMQPTTNPAVLMDNLKSMMLTMAMVKGTTQNSDDPKQTLFHTFLLILLLSFIDGFILQLKNLLGLVTTQIHSYVSSKSLNKSLVKLVENKLSANLNKTASVIIKIDNSAKNAVSDAVIDILTNLPHTKCILLENNVYQINYGDEIPISKNIFAKLTNSSNYKLDDEEAKNEKNDSSSTEPPVSVKLETNDNSPTQKYQFVDIYSYNLNMEELRNEINEFVKNYLIKVTNKLGNNIYYFNEIPLQVYRDVTGQIDYSKLSGTLHFSMKKFTTNRSFQNLFGANIDVIRNRVDFFLNNKDWYNEKGVPYTLGIMASGNPGTGKTSLIKCIANETKRHIINVHLSDTMTKTQIENLFYNEQLCITQNGKTEIYTIPISRRLYVLEDIDCQCDVIIDRNILTAEQELIEKNKKLKEEVEQLKASIYELSSTGRMTKPLKTTGEQDVKKDVSSEKITLSFLLNIFDGILETPDRITIMTTNFIDKLDKAFTRPGRIDVISKFGLADSYQIIQMIEHRYDTKLTSEQFDIICNLGDCITPAETSRILFENFNNLDGALAELVNYSLQYMQQNELKEKELKEKVIEENELKETEQNSEEFEEEKSHKEQEHLMKTYGTTFNISSLEKDIETQTAPTSITTKRVNVPSYQLRESPTQSFTPTTNYKQYKSFQPKPNVKSNTKQISSPPESFDQLMNRRLSKETNFNFENPIGFEPYQPLDNYGIIDDMSHEN